jgi:hypothetical protein
MPTPAGKLLRGRATACDMEERLLAIARALVSGASTSTAIREAAEDWGVSRRQAQRYVRQLQLARDPRAMRAWQIARNQRDNDRANSIIHLTLRRMDGILGRLERTADGLR